YKTAVTATQNLEARFQEFDCYIKDMFDLGHYQYRRESTSGSAPHIEIHDHYSNQNKEMINLASNDYLNLAKHPKVIDAGIQALKKYGAGAGSVPLLAGTLSIHKELERRVAKFKSTDDAIIFPSGFVSNYGFLSTILQVNDVAILDMYAHASLFEGCIASNKLLFKHNDMKSLKTVLEKL
ncbi:MAG: pyridoxal phosphate-dependent aminotransferase family protein, partial [Bacteroidetes bacterium]|nr:pyridoxal phosphate-dependent aminotransferase family protein [Bacteroidota bacterium]